MLKPWLVVTPEYGTVIPILDDGTGPMEYGCDAAWVEAETKHDALILGVKIMRDRGDRWLQDAECPYAGVTVEPAPSCEHGTPPWAAEDCPGCLADWNREAGEGPCG